MLATFFAKPPRGGFMFRAILFSSVLVTSVAVGNDIQDAEACGRNIGLRKVAKINRLKASKNPSRILIVGKKDPDLLRMLRGARHHVEYSPSVTATRGTRFDLIIADESKIAGVRSRFSNSVILKKRTNAQRTSSVAEGMLDRIAQKTNSKRGLLAVRESRNPSVVGFEGAEKRVASDTGLERPQSSPARGLGESSKARKDEGKEKRVSLLDTNPRQDSRVTESSAATRASQTTPNRDDSAKKQTTGGSHWTRSITFGSNKSKLGPEQLRHLERNALRLKRDPTARVTIEGHTDSVGRAAYNLALSERRANMARDFLIAFGISADRIFVKAKGEQEPAFKPSTSSRNRRIVMIKK